MRCFITLLLLSVTFQACGQPCAGTYTERDAAGNLKKYNDHTVSGMSGCVKDNMELSHFEATMESRTKRSVKCTPQYSFSSTTLVSSNNFYSYRDGKVYLDLNSLTGEYSKLTLAEDKSGNPVYTKLVGCFYERSGQILLDTTDSASSQYFDPMEIFTYTASSSTLEMVRYDDSVDWDYRFCPYLDTPWGFCDSLRNGNEMYFSTLTPAQQTATLNEAFLIRKQFNYLKISQNTFNSLWNNVDNAHVEKVREDYKYAVQTIVDSPRYIEQAWAQYIRKLRPTMPDITSSRMPPVCYPAKRTVTLSNGSTSLIRGEVCYLDGAYTWSADL